MKTINLTKNVSVISIKKFLDTFLNSPNLVITKKYGYEFHKLFSGIDLYGVVVHRDKESFVYRLDNKSGHPSNCLTTSLASDILFGTLNHDSRLKPAA